MLEVTTASVFSWCCNEDIAFIANTQYALAILTEKVFKEGNGEKSFSFVSYLLHHFPQKLKAFLVVDHIFTQGDNALDMVKYMLEKPDIFISEDIPVFVLCSGCMTPVFLLDEEETNYNIDDNQHVNDLSVHWCPEVLSQNSL